MGGVKGDYGRLSTGTVPVESFGRIDRSAMSPGLGEAREKICSVRVAMDLAIGCCRDSEI